MYNPEWIVKNKTKVKRKYKKNPEYQKKKRTVEKMRPTVQLTYFNSVFSEFSLQRL